MRTFFPSAQVDTQTNSNDMSGWAAAAGAGGQILGAGISAGANAAISKRQRRFQELQTDKQYSRQIEQRDYANWYNSPTNQRQLLLDAGMNPNLAYGSVSTQSGMPRPEKAEGQFPKFPNLNLDPLGSLLKYAGTKKVIAETDKVNKEVIAQDIRNDILSSSKQILIDQKQASLDLQKAKATTEEQKQAVYNSQVLLNAERTAYEHERAKFAKKGIFQGDSPLLRMIGKYGEAAWDKFLENFGPDKSQGSILTLPERVEEMYENR